MTTGGRSLALGGPVQRRLLAALIAHAPHPVSSDVLVDDVWGGTPPATAIRTLHSHVARLRDALGRESDQPIETVDGRYRLSLSRRDLDAWVFEDLVDDATSNGHAPADAATMLRRALGLWRGAAYAEFLGLPFADAESRRLEALRDRALDATIEAELASGGGADLVPELEALVVEHPYQERLWSGLVIALYRAGRQADALEAFQRARALLGDELGIDPGPELRAVEAKVLAQDPSLLASESPPSRTCPWKGLATYEPTDADYFVGRDALISETIARLVDYSVVIVTGPSGSGKSSLLRAGVVPALAAGALIGSENWRVEIVSPGNEPVTAIRAALSTRPDLLVVDPGDDLLIAASPDDGGPISEELRTAIAKGMRLLMSLRGDLFGRLTELTALAPRAAVGTVLVGVPHDEELREVVQLPARRAGLEVEPALVEAVVADVSGRPASLPLLSTALVRTWERRDGTVLTLSGYLAAGGATSALERLAEEAYESLGADERLAVRRILLRLVTHVDGVWRRRRVPPQELVSDDDPAAGVALRTLSSHRLVSVDVGDVQISHEALIVAWPRLTAWLADRELTANVLEHLSTAAHAWMADGRDDADLYRGARLQAALDLQAAQPEQLDPLEREFVERSRTVAEQEVARLRQGRRRLGYVAAVLVLLLVACSLAFVVALRSRDDAAQAAREADAQRVGLQALSRSDASQRLLLAVAAVRLDDNAGTRASLLSALQGAGAEATTVPLADVAQSLSVSADGWVGVVEEGGTVETFDPGLRAQALMDPQASWTRGTATAALQWLDGHSSMVIGASDPPRIFSLNPRNGGVSAIASGWNPSVFGVTGDDRWLVGTDVRPGSRDLLARPFEVSTEEFRIPLAAEPVSIIPAPGSAVTAIERGAIESIDVVSGTRLSKVAVPASALATASTDGSTAAFSTADGAIEVISLATGQATRPIPPLDQPLSALALSADGSLLAGVTPRDGAIRIWSVATGLERARFTAKSEIASLAWAAGGRLLAAPVELPALQAWDVDRYASPSSSVLAARPLGAGRSVSTAVDPTARRLAVGTESGGVWFLDVDSGRVRSASGPAGAPTVSVGFADNGRRTLTADAVGVLTVWDVATATPVKALTSPISVDSRTDGARAPIAPDGRTAASFIDGFGLRLIDVVTGRIGTPVYPDLGLQSQFEVRGWSPDSRHVVVVTQGVSANPAAGRPAGVWALVDPYTGAVIWKMDAPEQNVAAEAVFGEQGRTIVVPGESGKLHFINASDGTLLSPAGAEDSGSVAANQRQTPASVSVSPSGRLLSVVSTAHPVEIWDVASGQQSGSIDVPASTFAAHFLSDDELVSVTTEGAVTMHDLRVPNWISLACRSAGRELTLLEWQQFLPAYEYRPVCAPGTSGTEWS